MFQSGKTKPRIQTIINKRYKVGDTIGRIIILELTERDSSAFEDILSFLSRHPDLKKWELRDEPILSFPGLEINPVRSKKQPPEKDS